MAKVVIEFDTDNAAFEDDVATEVVAVLKRIGQQFASTLVVGFLDGKPIRDSYGNTVGTITVKKG